MITFNGLTFAKNANELVESLFINDGTGTASGLYKTTKRGTKLYKPNGELFAYIVHNSKQGYFVVSASMREGKPFYMFSICSLDEKYLGIDKIGMLDLHNLVKSFVKQFN